MAYVEANSDLAGYALAGARERELLLQRMLAADLLVLDDLFLAKRVSEAAAELLQTLVHQRYQRRASVLVTFNPFEFRAGIHSRDDWDLHVYRLRLNPFEFRSGIHSVCVRDAKTNVTVLIPLNSRLGFIPSVQRKSKL